MWVCIQMHADCCIMDMKLLLHNDSAAVEQCLGSLGVVTSPYWPGWVGGGNQWLPPKPSQTRHWKSHTVGCFTLTDRPDCVFRWLAAYVSTTTVNTCGFSKSFQSAFVSLARLYCLTMQSTYDYSTWGARWVIPFHRIGAWVSVVMTRL